MLTKFKGLYTIEVYNSKRKKEEKKMIKNLKGTKGITLIALVITILFSYGEMIKFSNSKGFLLAII